MKNKSRLFKVLIVICILSMVVRFGNLCILIMGDYEKKNVYALSHTGYYVWEILDYEDVHFGMTRDGEKILHLSEDCELSQWTIRYWDILGVFGVHNIETFYAISQECTDEGFNDYHVIMDKFTVAAIIFECVILAIHVMAIIFLIKSCEFSVEKMVDEDSNSIQVKQCNLKWKFIELFTYSIMIETIICIIKTNGYYVNLMFWGILFLVPVYILTTIVIMILYFNRKKKIKIQV